MKTREPEAWRRLVDLYAPLIYGWCRHSGLQAADAADVVQDVFASVANSVDDYHGSHRQGSFRAWLKTITRRRICDYLQQRGSVRAEGGTTALQNLLQVPELPEPSDSSGTPEAGDIVWRRELELVRAEFEERTWRAFWRVVVDGQRPVDVADELGMTIHAVYKAKSRVLRRVREELGDLEEDI